MLKLLKHELSTIEFLFFKNPAFFSASDVLHTCLIVILEQAILGKLQEHSEASSGQPWLSAAYPMTVPLAARGTKAHYPHACPGTMRSQITTEDPQLDHERTNGPHAMLPA